MTAPLLARLLPLVLIAALLIACGGDGGSPDERAPRDLIAFGALDAENGQYALYLVRPDGSELRRLTDEDGFVFFPRWSPTEDRVAYVVGEEGRDTPGALRVYDLATGAAITVSEQALPSLDGPAAAWSPEGDRLAFVESAGGGRLRIFDLEDGELVDLPDVRATALDWSPARGELVVVSPTDAGETDLFLVDADGDEPRPLLERPSIEGAPRWSPDGRQIAFWAASADSPDDRELFVIDRDGGSPRQVGPGFALDWSPDGARLAYSAPASGNPANREVYVVVLDGGEPEPLSPEASVSLDSWPSWSPGDDGRLVYAALVDRQTAFLCIARLDPSEQNCLDLPGLVPSAPAWD